MISHCLFYDFPLFIAGVAPADVLDLIFDLLDYMCWQSETRPWKTLSDQLLQIYERSALLLVLYSLTSGCSLFFGTNN